MKWGKVLLAAVIIVTFIVIICSVSHFFLKTLNEVESSHSDAKQIAQYTIKDFPELKDLGKSFLTLLIAVFVASITFSEKIVNHQSATIVAKSFLIICWALTLFSVAMVGAGICFFYQAYYFALHYDNFIDNTIERGYVCYIIGGISFGTSLVCMLYAAISSYLIAKQPKT